MPPCTNEGPLQSYGRKSRMYGRGSQQGRHAHIRRSAGLSAQRPFYKSAPIGGWSGSCSQHRMALAFAPKSGPTLRGRTRSTQQLMPEGQPCGSLSPQTWLGTAMWVYTVMGGSLCARGRPSQPNQDTLAGTINIFRFPDQLMTSLGVGFQSGMGMKLCPSMSLSWRPSSPRCVGAGQRPGTLWCLTGQPCSTQCVNSGMASRQ